MPRKKKKIPSIHPGEILRDEFMKPKCKKRLLRLFAFLIIVFLIPLPLLAAPACPPEGDGGDHALNILKNRTGIPTPYEEMDVNHFISEFTPNLHTPKYRDRFSPSDRQYVEKQEKRGIALVGYILGARRSGPESFNCHDPVRHDFHVWIGPDRPGTPEEAKGMRARSVVVEPTPYGQEHHPGWKLRALERLVQQSSKVRISGWAMYDPEHPDQLGKTRGTLWEVHPVTKIEVWSGGKWRAL